MTETENMTPEEKALLQAKHRQEEAETRNRLRERNARTHRLVQEGAILESIAPWVIGMPPEQIKLELQKRLGAL